MFEHVETPVPIPVDPGAAMWTGVTAGKALLHTIPRFAVMLARDPVLFFSVLELRPGFLHRGGGVITIQPMGMPST